MNSKICSTCGGNDRVCGGGDDIPTATIGFAATCPSVTCRGGTSCGGTVSTLQQLVNCVSCVSNYKGECVDRIGDAGHSAPTHRMQRRHAADRLRRQPHRRMRECDGTDDAACPGEVRRCAPAPDHASSRARSPRSVSLHRQARQRPRHRLDRHRPRLRDGRRLDADGGNPLRLRPRHRLADLRPMQSRRARSRSPVRPRTASAPTSPLPTRAPSPSAIPRHRAAGAVKRARAISDRRCRSRPAPSRSASSAA